MSNPTIEALRDEQEDLLANLAVARTDYERDRLQSELRAIAEKIEGLDVLESKYRTRREALTHAHA